MARKAKTPGARAEPANGTQQDVGASRKRIRDFEDVADSEDEFHIGRDRVLLDEAPDAKRRRKWQEEEEFLHPSDEEVLAYDDSEEQDEEGVDGQDEPVAARQRAVASDSGDSDVGGDNEEGELRWGTSKDDLYGADVIETEEQALEEEAEALRLQKKQFQSMSEADFGFDEEDWKAGEPLDDSAERHDPVVTEVLPQLQVGEDVGPAERLKLLKTRYPEFEPLSKELIQLREIHLRLSEDYEQTNAASNLHPPSSLETKVRAAAAYLGSLTMYFALLTSSASREQEGSMAMSASLLHSHPVMDSLVKCRELWLKVKDLPGDLDMAAGEIKDPEQNEPETTTLDLAAQKPVIPKPAAKKSRAARHAEAAQAAAEARKAERMQRVEADLGGLDDLLASSARRSSAQAKNLGHMQDGADSDMGEQAAPTAREAAEKAKRKKSLRFYTSQIAQRANKRGAAGRSTGGDDDIPYRERLKDRQARLNAEAEKRGQRTTADPADDLGAESDEEDRRNARQVRDEADAEGDYYDLIAARTAKKKADKVALAAAQKEAAEHGGRVVPEETVGADGKRKITYAIEKNKGLTPHRKKEVRNPRVKKRKKFDEKKKKLGSVKAVYKGGEGRGGYRGELTGIKKGLVKSVKF